MDCMGYKPYMLNQLTPESRDITDGALRIFYGGLFQTVDTL